MLMSSLKICELEASVEKEWGGGAGSVVDPDPWDVFRPPDFGSVIILYGSGSFHQHPKKGSFL